MIAVFPSVPGRTCGADGTDTRWAVADTRYRWAGGCRDRVCGCHRRRAVAPGRGSGHPSAEQPSERYRAEQQRLPHIDRLGPGAGGRRPPQHLRGDAVEPSRSRASIYRRQRRTYRPGPSGDQRHDLPTQRGCATRGRWRSRSRFSQLARRRQPDELGWFDLGRRAGVGVRSRFLLDVLRWLWRRAGPDDEFELFPPLTRRLLGSPRHHPARVQFVWHWRADDFDGCGILVDRIPGRLAGRAVGRHLRPPTRRHHPDVESGRRQRSHATAHHRHCHPYGRPRVLGGRVER